MTTEERRNEIKKILSKQQRETLDSIAIRLGVSTRTIQRDIDAISRVVPVYASTGRHGGVFVCDTYQVSRMYMTSSELQVLNKVINIAEANPHLMEPADLQTLHMNINDYTRPEAAAKKGLEN